MQQSTTNIQFSATDLVVFLGCEHLTALDLQALQDPSWRAHRTADDATSALTARKGTEHEHAHLARLRGQGLVVVDVAEGGGSIADKAARTLDAMAAGADVVFQATLCDGPWVGHADFLRKIDGGPPSRFGNWSYEVADTKLARSPKAKFLVQLAFYSQLLALAQGVAPRQMQVVLGDQRVAEFRCADYLHYLAALQRRFRQRVDQLQAGAAQSTYPEPCAHCDLCHWRDRCQAQRVADDHLCLVANISRVQLTKLQAQGVATLAQLAGRPATQPVAGMLADTYVRLQSQAALQEQARRSGHRALLVLPLDPEGKRGFFRLPQPDEGDLFFDMEGDPLEPGGLEYLLGVWLRDGAASWCFRAFWAHDRVQERLAFEQFVDFVCARRRQFPGAHVYHYASYEESALKRLASFHATREVEVDDFLRQGVLVDLYKVVREGLRVSEPSYSIKYVEHYYRPARAGDVQNAGASIVAYEHWRETQDALVLDDIAAYNRDDVESTWQLRDWLLGLRPQGVPWFTRQGAGDATRGADADAAAATITRAQEAEQRLVPYRQRLVDPLPADRATWSLDQQVGELAWQLLDFHRRADKPAWWALYARMDMDEEALLDDAECLAGLTLDPDHPPEPVKRSMLYTYRVPPQDIKLADGDDCTCCDTAQALAPIALSCIALVQGWPEIAQLAQAELALGAGDNGGCADAPAQSSLI